MSSSAKLHLGWVVRLFLIAALAAGCGSGTALATCSPKGPVTSGEVPCYVTVQPIDVGVLSSGQTTPVYAPFNTVSAAGLPYGSTDGTTPMAGYPSQALNTSDAPGTLVGSNSLLGATTSLTVPTNSRSTNPIGFVVDPTTGLSPGQANYNSANGIDVTRALLNNLGVELVWLPMEGYAYSPPQTPTVNPCPPAGAPGNASCTAATQDFTTLSVNLAAAGFSANPPQSVASCTGYISNTTLTISACSTAAGHQPLAVYDFLSGTGVSANTDGSPATYITALGTGSGAAGTYTIFPSQTAGGSKKQITFTVYSYTLTSSLFKTLSDQNRSTATPPVAPCGISQMTIPPTGGCGGPSPSPPLSPNPGTINLFFVNKLQPPAALSGTLYGFSWIGNNGVAIGASTFAQPGRPDTIAHELMHNLGLDHTTYGAGPWTAPTYTAGGGVVNAPPISALANFAPAGPATPLPGECDLVYTACGDNLMTTGSIRTEPTPACILNGITLSTGEVTTPGCVGLPSFFLGTADQVTFPSGGFSPSAAAGTGSSAQLPISQQAQVLGPSGLLFDNTNPPLPINFAGSLDPIPKETTKAQLGTGGSSTKRADFDLSGPVDGRPGETLVGWILTLPEDQTFARSAGFHIISQSRHDLVQDVKYYPGPGTDSPRRNIAYRPGGDNNADDRVGASPCAFESAECLAVKFQAPGLEANDAISFSERILSGDAPVTNEDLCKAKITYIFSDGFVTTSNFGRCSPGSIPLANSWRPDPHVAPHIVKSNVLLADGSTTLPCTIDVTTGQCPDTTQNANISDVDVTMEANSRSCDGGASFNNPVTGTISASNVILQGGQTCNYVKCEFKGSLTINSHARAFLQNCTVDGNIVLNEGTLNLAPSDQSTSVFVHGNVAIGSPQTNLPSSFSIGPGVSIHGNLEIQNLPQVDDSKQAIEQLGYVCGTQISGGLTANNNMTLLDIGQASSPAPTCPGNQIAGGLNCKGNQNLTGGANNLVSGSVSAQCSSLVQ